MIERYNCPEISTIWEDESKFKTYLEVELALLKALEGNVIPAGVSKEYTHIKIRPERISEIEATTKHDVIAFCTSITEQVKPEVSKYFHYGCTSSDIIDTATNLQIKRSLELEIEQVLKLEKALFDKAEQTKEYICMGRSHGMSAEPMSFGQKFLSFAKEIQRRRVELQDYLKNEITGQFSGAVGNYTVLTPAIEKKAVESLGLVVEPVSTQVIPRDRIAKLISFNALLAAALERIAVEIRHLHHSDISELHEGFSKGQKGSSTMPHKKNPVSAENITGIARVIKSHVSIALDNVVLWHERDISHSSAERLILPDNFGLIYYALKRMTSTVQNLVIHQEIIENKVLSQSGFLSSYILHKLINTSSSTREEIYAKVQSAAFQSKNHHEFISLIAKDFDIELKELSDYSKEMLKGIYLKNIDDVFKRSI